MLRRWKVIVKIVFCLFNSAWALQSFFSGVTYLLLCVPGAGGAQGRRGLVVLGRNHAAMFSPSYFISVCCLLPTLLSPSPPIPQSTRPHSSPQSRGALALSLSLGCSTKEKWELVCLCAYIMHLSDKAVLQNTEAHTFGVSNPSLIISHALFLALPLLHSSISYV